MKKPTEARLQEIERLTRGLALMAAADVADKRAASTIPLNALVNAARALDDLVGYVRNPEDS